MRGRSDPFLLFEIMGIKYCSQLFTIYDIIINSLSNISDQSLAKCMAKDKNYTIEIKYSHLNDKKFVIIRSNDNNNKDASLNYP